MQKLKQIFSFKSFRGKVLIAALLVVFTLTLFWLGGFFSKTDTGQTTFIESLDKGSKDGKNNVNIDILAGKCDRDIDSILFNFGIKKEWINTVYKYEKNQLTEQEKSAKEQKVKKENTNVRWFSKDVAIPKDLTTAEINLDLTTYVNFLGLDAVVNEDIRTTAINYAIYSPSDTNRSSSLPLVKINITPADKIKRDAGSLILIINQINDFKSKELENILNSVNEFSFIFPRNPEEIELQNKLLQMKKDVIVNLTIGANDNYEADFRIDMEEKEIKQKVKSINSDFPSVKTAIISKINPQVPNDIIFRIVTEEFQKNGLKTFRDTILTKLISKDEEDSDNKIQLILSRLKEKASLMGKVISVLTLSNDEFLSFLDEVQTLKKRGYKFYTLTEFIGRERQREDKIKIEAKAKEKEVKKEVKKDTKKKAEKKKPVQKKTGKDKKKK